MNEQALRERTFQNLIQEYLVDTNGYLKGNVADFDKHYAIDTEQLFAFLEDTQAETLAKLKDVYKGQFRDKILSALDKEIQRNGMYHVLRKGWKDYGHHLKLVFFEPPTKLNADLNALYAKNRFSVTEELVYTKANENRIDLVLFVNGMPIFAFELKTETTKQSVEHGMRQWKKDRSPKDKLFHFKQRVLVCFAMDTSEVYMTTKLNGDKTRFLPFNLGHALGKGNPRLRARFARTTCGSRF